MTNTTHLEKIKAKCLANLAIAEKRAAGKWMYDACCVISRCNENEDDARRHVDGGWYRVEVEGEPSACKFLASCAGAAEAGWRSTIAAIDYAAAMPGYIWRDSLEALIIAAWPEELL